MPYREYEVPHNEQARQRYGHGWSWLQIVFTVIAALVILKYSPTWYSSSKSDISHFYPEMKFNSSTLYPALYISDDDTIITNRQTSFTNRISSGPRNLHKYTGVIMNKGLSMKESMYFEVKTTYKSVLGPETGLLFEIGFKDVEELDKHLLLINNPGTIFVRVLTCGADHKYICLAGYDGKTAYQIYYLSLIEQYKAFDIRFGFHINPDDDVIQVTYSFDNNKIPVADLYTFEAAEIDDNMWPVFAMYNPNKFEINMELVNARDMLFDTSTVHPMIYISDNGLELSNIPTKTTRRMSFRDGQLQKYEGVIGDISIDLEKTKFQKWPKTVNFAVLVEYNISEKIYSTLLFEIGLSRPEYIDKHWSVGPHKHAISVFGGACNDFKKVCLYSSRKGKGKVVAVLSSSQVGSHFKGIITFLINFPERTVKITSDYSTFIFDNVDFNEPMWPVFALYKHIVDAKMIINQNFERSWKDKLLLWFSSLQNSVQRT